MSGYISSKDNRFYVATETEYGEIATVSAANRIPAVALGARQQLDRIERRDKTGGRTFVGLPAGLRKSTTFELRTYLTAWTDQTQEPSYGPLFHAALGNSALIFGGGTAQSISGTQLQFSAAHGLQSGQAITFGGEIRFAAAIVDSTTVQLNAPFSISPSVGSPIGKTCTYTPGGVPPSVSIFDYWSPSSSVHRVLCGAAVDRMRINVNGDFHEFEFNGMAADVLDSSSFVNGEGGASSYPVEPLVSPLNYSIVPGHLGEIWLGAAPTQFLTLTSAELRLDNAVDLRSREFGSALPRGIIPGVRNVMVTMSVFEKDDEGTAGLYQAARQQTPIGVMFQLGQLSGQLMGVYMKGIVPEVPEFDDSETRLQWKFTNCRAQGTVDDELYIAFG